ncbi:MAG TPA: hypothetical protein VGP57_11330 [Actinoplanes sp.]|nr:hypothetical protein [Actinoplanes sp.]
MGARHRSVTGLLVSLLAAGLVTGCGSGGGTPSTEGSSRMSSEPGHSGSSLPPSASSSPSPAGPRPSAQAGEVTLSGQVEAGVEANCLVLRSGGQTYNLLGGDKNIVKPGNNVVVRGHVAEGVMSYCMQGKPFQVTEARPA